MAFAQEPLQSHVLLSCLVRLADCWRQAGQCLVLCAEQLTSHTAACLANIRNSCKLHVLALGTQG